jgi:hypothetical protein
VNSIPQMSIYQRVLSIVKDQINAAVLSQINMCFRNLARYPSLKLSAYAVSPVHGQVVGTGAAVKVHNAHARAAKLRIRLI